ncbi:TonB-dependent receptor [Chryseobacterium sp. POL2]|uniref:TonB-dependent receptor n=1 Tax=Chryseobacterium sp. POL2 TaxID=2713414 RepID=UPI0013E10449|nr:TonB-dependent receptor plug domain-containing protein [Chryseobacterium sp. POL2]QIG89233.1 TonB-dependent receptor [Chryseobacterium sp. POL2]
MTRFLSFLFLVGLSALSLAQKIELNISVHNEKNQAVPNANLKISNQKPLKTDAKGEAKIFLEKNKNYSIVVSHNAYQDRDLKITPTQNQHLVIKLLSENTIQEVVVTAKEAKGLTSKSVITTKAMEHLQPSSFADIMELVPGGLAKTPTLTSSNRVLLRESDSAPSSYNTSALGTQFIIDNNIWNSNADMQLSLNDSQFLSGPQQKAAAGIGVDMRTLSTNDIERVEIIRGIPSASYGDLTSGVIKIDRKIGKTPLQARFKADGFSKQYYISKGFALKQNWQMTSSLDFLDAKVDPTNQFENYQRVTASLRSRLKTKLWNKHLEWRSTLDFSNNIDKEKNDPDTGYAPIDAYKNSNSRLSLTNNFVYILGKENLFNKLTLNTSIRQGFDKIEQTKLVQQSGPRSISLATTQGENVGIFPQIKYISEFYTDGKPMDVSTLLQLNGVKKSGLLLHQYEVGVDWRFSKNFGKGQQYDLLTPPTATMNVRPRAYDDIPAWQVMAVFIGDQMSYQIDEHKLNLYAGLRTSNLLGVDKSFSISKQFFFEPRLNFQYGLPKIYIGNHALRADFTLGYGQFYKQPTLLMLYPNTKYMDYTQLNYYHNDERYRYVNFMTYVQSLENKNLTAAKNTKYEARLDLNYRNHEFFVTYFQEEMTNGFRSTLQTVAQSYKKYDPAYVDINDWNNGPNLDNIPYQMMTEFGSYSITENGSATIKRGIEFGYTSPRFEAINTRFTLTGAYFNTQYRNTIPVHEKPNSSIGGSNFPYYGIYKNDDGYINSNLNYNFFVDTYLPNLDLTLSASFQGTLFDHRKRDHRMAEPISYYGVDGIIHNFTDADRTDIYKQWLVRDVSKTDNLETRYTYTLNANFKVTKKIYKALRTSMFVNKLFGYAHPYYMNGIKIERKNLSTPYFGMELNYNF